MSGPNENALRGADLISSRRGWSRGGNRMTKLISRVLAGLIVGATLSGFAIGAEPSGGAAKYSYLGATGPEHWGDLDPSFATCKDGKAQSPIDIKDAEYSASAGIKFDYNPGRLEVLDHDDSEVSDERGDAIVIDGKTYKLYNVHFHHPSEHTIAGKSFPLEAHLVHKADDGTLAVIGVMVVQGRADRGISELPDKDHPGRMDATAAALLPRSRGFYRYDGSLTTPPCGEGVIWSLMEHPIEMSAEQIAAFESPTGDNARPVQPLNGRKILRSNK